MVLIRGKKVHLADGRTYAGTLTAGFPDKISVDVDGITSSVFTNTISTLKFGDPSNIETAERTYQGKIISSLPQAIQMQTKFGGFAINRTDIISIAFSPKRIALVGQFGFGLGTKFIGSAPLLFMMQNGVTSASRKELTSVLLQLALDKNYQEIKAKTYTWPGARGHS